MQYEFKIIAFTNDPQFSILLTRECDKYGFMLTFIDNINEIKEELDDSIISVAILDLNETSLDPFSLCVDIKKEHGLPVFGVLQKFSKHMQEKAKKHGFDLIFTKKMLIRSIREVVIHVSNE